MRLASFGVLDVPSAAYGEFPLKLSRAFGVLEVPSEVYFAFT
jgi:hypothetical protein